MRRFCNTSYKGMNIIIINGPNLNLLGKREPTIYGSQSFEDYLDVLKSRYPDVNIEYYQSNVEGELIDTIQETGFISDGIVLNAGAPILTRERSFVISHSLLLHAGAQSLDSVWIHTDLL